MRKRKNPLILLLAWWLLLPAASHPATYSLMGTDKAQPVDKGTLVIQPIWAYTFTTGMFTGNWRRVSAGGDYTNFSQLLKLTYGVRDRMEVFLLMVTYTHNWASQVDIPGPKGERGANFGGIGNLLLAGKYQLAAEGPNNPAVTAFGGTILPTAHYRRLNPSNLWMDQLGDGGYQFLLGFNAQKDLKPVTLYGNLWYQMATDFTGDGVDANGLPAQVRFHPRDGVICNLAAECPLSPRWMVQLEMISSWDGGRLIGPKANQAPAAYVTLSPALAYLVTDRFSLALGVAVTVYGKNTDAPVTPLLSAAYAF